MASPARAFIFDLDGVLVDTEPLYTRATQEVVAPFGKTYDWTLKARCMGQAATASAAIVIESLALPLTPEDFLARRRPILERLFEQVPEVPGAGALLETLHRAGALLALATSSDRRLLTLKTRHHPWMSYFRAVVCGDDPVRPKPAPDAFLLAAERLNVPASECIIFEDSPSGVRAGVAAGMRVVALCDPALDRALLAGAQRVISSFSELDPLELVARAVD